MRVDGGLDLLRTFQQQNMRKGAGAGEALGELHRMFTVIFVIDSDSRVGDFQRCREREQDNLNQHR